MLASISDCTHANSIEITEPAALTHGPLRSITKISHRTGTTKFRIGKLQIADGMYGRKRKRETARHRRSCGDPQYGSQEEDAPPTPPSTVDIATVVRDLWSRPVFTANSSGKCEYSTPPPSSPAAVTLGHAWTVGP